MSGAMALAEGGRRFKVDVDVIFENARSAGRNYVLRTVFDDLEVWRTKYSEPMDIAPQGKKGENQNKPWAVIDREVWVFRIDATNAADLKAAIEIAARHYCVNPDVFLQDIYVKNINVERENDLGLKAVVEANKSLYQKTGEALCSAAKALAYRGELRLHVFSNNVNPKIPKADLHEALKNAQAESVVTDGNKYEYLVSKNDNTQRSDFPPIKTHHHLAVFSIR
jgi:hypothetical protein